MDNLAMNTDEIIIGSDTEQKFSEIESQDVIDMLNPEKHNEISTPIDNNYDYETDMEIEFPNESFQDIPSESYEDEEMNSEDDSEEDLKHTCTCTCSFEKGYIKQDIYSCLTCFRETKIIAGLCYDCVSNCHEEHDIVFAGTFDKFRCDCGIDSKFPKTICEFDPMKNQETNTENKYPCVHEFIGVFCKDNCVHEE